MTVGAVPLAAGAPLPSAPSWSRQTIRSPTCFIVAGIKGLQVKGVMHEPKR